MSNSANFAYFKIPLTVSELRWGFYFEENNENLDTVNHILIENPDFIYYILKEGSDYEGYCIQTDFE